MNIKKADAIITEINNTVANWSIYANMANVKSELQDKINKNLELL